MGTSKNEVQPPKLAPDLKKIINKTSDKGSVIYDYTIAKTNLFEKCSPVQMNENHSLLFRQDASFPEVDVYTLL